MGVGKVCGAERWSADFEAEYAIWQEDPFTIAPQGGESGLNALDRILPVVRRIVETHRHRSVLVVSHKGANRLVISSLLGFDVRSYRDRPRSKSGGFEHPRLHERGASAPAPLQRRLSLRRHSGPRVEPPALQVVEPAAPAAPVIAASAPPPLHGSDVAPPKPQRAAAEPVQSTGERGRFPAVAPLLEVTMKEDVMSLDTTISPTGRLKDLYDIGDMPPLGHVPAEMHAWLIRAERFGEPKQAFQKDVVAVRDRRDEALVYVMAAGINYNNVWAGLGIR